MDSTGGRDLRRTGTREFTGPFVSRSDPFLPGPDEFRTGLECHQTCPGGYIVILRTVHYFITVNYCPVCKREYKETGGHETRNCPVCGSMLVQISENNMDQVRQDKAHKKI
jgi:hypothetical protein